MLVVVIVLYFCWLYFIYILIYCIIKNKLIKMIYILSVVYDFNFYSNLVVIFFVLVIVKIEFNMVIGGYFMCFDFFCC